MNKYIKKYINKAKKFLNLSRCFGIKNAFEYIKNRYTLENEKFTVYVQQFLEEIFRPVIDHYENGGNGLYPIKKCRQMEGNIVWVCWWQGRSNMPDAVEMCVNQMESLCSKIPDVTFVLITKDNYRNYIELPTFVIDKLEKGYITLITFSDILRQCLLSTYGGAWIDSTVFCTSEKGIEETFRKSYFSIKIEPEKVNNASEGQVLTGGKWAGFFLNNTGVNVFSFVRDCLLYYFERYNYLIDYFIQNYCIKIAFDHFKLINKMIESQPIFCNHVYYIEECKKKGLSVGIKEDTCFYKLSYKHFTKDQIRQIREYMDSKGILQ